MSAEQEFLVLFDIEARYAKACDEVALLINQGRKAEAIRIMPQVRLIGQMAKQGLLTASFATRWHTARGAQRIIIEESAESAAKALEAEGGSIALEATAEITKRSGAGWRAAAARFFGRFAGPLVLVMVAKDVYDVSNWGASKLASMQLMNKMAQYHDYSEEYFASTSIIKGKMLGYTEWTVKVYAAGHIRRETEFWKHFRKLAPPGFA